MKNKVTIRKKQTNIKRKVHTIARNLTVNGDDIIVNTTLTNEYFDTPVIYTLYHNDKIVYIGETTCLMYRIGQHTKNKEFDYFKYFKTSSSTKQRKSIEASLILKHQPKYNIACKTKAKKKEIVLVSNGMTV